LPKKKAVRPKEYRRAICHQCGSKQLDLYVKIATPPSKNGLPFGLFFAKCHACGTQSTLTLAVCLDSKSPKIHSESMFQ
jgi:hypothetical protein